MPTVSGHPVREGRWLRSALPAKPTILHNQQRRMDKPLVGWQRAILSRFYEQGVRI